MSTSMSSHAAEVSGGGGPIERLLWFTESNGNKIGQITTGAGPAPDVIPTLSFPMLALLGFSLAGLGVLLLKRL